MTNDRYRHQRELFDPDLAGHQHVTVVGAGSVGSHVIALLASMGVRTMDIWDADRVEEHNLPALNNVYRQDDVGTFKVDAAQEFLVRQRLRTDLTLHREFVTAESPLNGVVFACTDSLESRGKIFAAAQANLATVPQFFDLRVGRTQIKIVRLSPADTEAAERYTSPLYLRPDAQVKPLPCAQRAVIDPAATVAALAVGQYRLWAAREFADQKEVMPKAVIMQDLDNIETVKSDTL